MNTKAALAHCKASLAAYLAGKGVDVSRPFICFNPAHDDTRPSMRFDRARNKAHCFACGSDYDTLDLIGIEYGLEGKELFRKAYELFGLNQDKNTKPGHYSSLTPKSAFSLTNTSEIAAEHDSNFDFSAYFTLCRFRLCKTTYALDRGLSSATLERFHIGYDPAWKHPRQAHNPRAPHSPRLIIPTGPNSYVARDTRCDVKGKARKYTKMKVGPVRLFNAEALAIDASVFVVEAEMDALSVIEAGGEAVGLGGVSNVKAFLNMVERIQPAKPLILSLDNDDAGIKAMEQLETGLKRLGIPFYRSNIAGVHKDPSEALERDRMYFISAVRDAEKIGTAIRSTEYEAYLRTSVAGHLNNFLDGRGTRIVIPTGFIALDTLLGGGLHEGLHVMGAVSSLGKTTLALQILDQAARSGHDVLFFSLEMSRDELIAKTLSRHSMEEALRQCDAALAKTMREIIDVKSRDPGSIEPALACYREYAERIFIMEGRENMGVQDIRAAVQNHIRLTGNKPVVLVDYLQMLAPEGERMTDKQNMDRSVVELKRISRDTKTPVIAVSSFNRAGYGDAVKMEGFKESGSIEYSADVLIGLQFAGVGHKNFNLEEAKNKTPREIELVILKNRNGPAGGKVILKYYAAYNYFETL